MAARAHITGQIKNGKERAVEGSFVHALRAVLEVVVFTKVTRRAARKARAHSVATCK